MTGNSDDIQNLSGDDKGDSKIVDKQATTDIQYYLLLKNTSKDGDYFILMEKDGQKKKYTGKNDFEDRNFDMTSKFDNYDDYFCVKISEEETSIMFNVQQRVIMKDSNKNENMIEYYKKVLNSDKTETGDNSENLDAVAAELMKVIHDKLMPMIKNITKSKDDLMNEVKKYSLISFTTNNLKRFNLKEDNVSKLTLDCVNIIDASCRQLPSFVTLIKDDDGLTNELNKSLEMLTKKEKLSQTEVEILTKILSIYWQILKSDTKKKNSKSEYMEKCFNHDQWDSPIKIGAALCLSCLIESSSSFYGELYIYLKEVHLGPQILVFSQEDILLGLGKISLSVKFDDVLTCKLQKSLNEIKTSVVVGKERKVTKDTHSHLKLLRDAIPKLDKTRLKIFESDEFISVTKTFLDLFLTKKKKKEILVPEVLLECIITNLDIVCQLTDISVDFVKTFVSDNNLLVYLKEIFKILHKKSVLSISDEQFLTHILLIYWNIYKSGEKLSRVPKWEEMEHCFRRRVLYNNFKLAAALCLTEMLDKMCPLLNEVEEYLTNICQSDNTRCINGFSKNEVFRGLSVIVLKKKSNSLPITNTNNSSTIRGKEVQIVKDQELEKFSDTNNSSTTPGNEVQRAYKLSNVCENVSKSEADVKKEVSNGSFISFTIQNLSKYNSHQQSGNVKVVNESEFTLDDGKIISTLSLQHKFRIKSIKEEDDLMKELNTSIEILTKKDQLSPIEEKVLTKILSTYLQILKTDCLTNIPKSEYLEKCFSLHKADSSIKIGASLCLSFLIDSSSSLYGEVYAYLREEHPKKFDIFSQDEILMGLGKISKKKVTDKVLTGTSDHINTMSSIIDHACYASIDSKNMSMTNLEEHQSAFMESNYPESVGRELITIEDFKRCLRVVTGNMKTLAYEDSKACIELSMNMDDKGILKNLISSSGPIDFEKDNAVCARIIGMDDEDVVLSLLNNCVTTVNDNGMLLGVAKRWGDGVASLVCKKIAGNKVTGVDNKNSLHLAFRFLRKDNLELFKGYIGICSDVNDYLDKTDTFLTKILRERDNDLIGEAIKVCQFDVNKCDKNDVSPICIACEKEDEITVDHVISISREIKDWRNARKIASNISIKDVSDSILKKLCSLP